jgi:hypothetical protein
LHSLVRNHALVDGNKRLALAGTIAFLGINGQQLRFSNDDAYDFVIAVATGELDQARATAHHAAGSRSTMPRDCRASVFASGNGELPFAPMRSLQGAEEESERARGRSASLRRAGSASTAPPSLVRA